MRWVAIYIFVLSVLGCITKISAQENSVQDDYVNSTQEKHNFNKNNWGNLKDRIIKESGGAYSSEHGGVEGSYYNYEDESYDGKYSEHKNDEEQYIYEEGQPYSEGDRTKGESNGGVNYYPKKSNGEYGQQDYHPKEKQFQRVNRKNNSVLPERGIGWLKYVLFGLLTALLAFLIYQFRELILLHLFLNPILAYNSLLNH